MYDGESKIRVEGENVIKETPVYDDYGNYAAHKREVVLTKDVFVECFLNWVAFDKPFNLAMEAREKK